MPRALDREAYRRLSVNPLAAREVPHTDTTLGRPIQATSAQYETWPRAGSLSGRGLRLQSSVFALAFEIAWLRGERRRERRSELRALASG